MKNILKLGMAAIVALLLVTTTTAVECPDGEVPICHLPDGVFFPHPNDCEWFFHCSNNVAYCMKCPADLHWNVELETCDYPYRAGCSGAIILVDCHSVKPDDFAGSAFYDCEGEKNNGPYESCPSKYTPGHSNKTMGKCAKKA